MKMKSLFLIIVSGTLHLTHSHEASISAGQYALCTGERTDTTVGHTCTTLPSSPSWSVWLYRGSCARFYRDSDSCSSGDSFIVGYPNSSNCRPDYPVKFATGCESNLLEFDCPQGSYIREIEHGSPNEGIGAHCYRPNETVPLASWRSHEGEISSPVKSSCPVAAHGMSFQYDGNEWPNAWNIFTNQAVECNRDLNLDDLTLEGEDEVEGVKRAPQNRTQLCDKGYVMTGITTAIDEAGVMKEFGIRCSPYLDPTSTCEPLEFLSLVVNCDNLASGNEMPCDYNKTVGVGLSRIMSAAERRELEFSAGMGFNIGTSIYDLSISMSSKLGESYIVNYQWSQTDTSTWKEETTAPATLIVRPHVHSRIEQLVGKCSFHGVSVNFFKQTDISSAEEVEVRYFSI